MTKKKRELIEILLDNVKPEDWPESLPYAAQEEVPALLNTEQHEHKRNEEPHNDKHQRAQHKAGV